MTILLVRPRLIGDVILTTPAIRALRRRFPEARLLYLVESLAAPVVARNPHLSDVIVIRHRRGWRRAWEDLRAGWALRRMRVDVAIDLHGGPRSGWLTWATRAPMRVGYDVSGRRWMYTHVVPRPRGYAPRHSVKNQWDLLAPVDPAFAGMPDPEHDRVEMPIDDAARQRAGTRLGALGVPAHSLLIVVHVGAGNEFRRWPAAAFARAIAALIDRPGDRAIVLLGARADADTVAEIRREVSAATPAAAARVVAALDWPLDEVRALIERARLFVGGDSGPMHVAATTDVPIVALFGPTLPVHWTPWRPGRLPLAAIEAGALPCRPCDQRVCEPGDFRCLTRIAPETVVAAAERLLEAS